MKYNLTILILFFVSMINSMILQDSNHLKVSISQRGFKCPLNHGIRTAIRINSHNQIECLSKNGISCINIKTVKECKTEIMKNLSSNKSITCVKPENKPWCEKAEKFFYKTWHCPNETGLEVAVRLTKDNKIECMSRNGNDCYYGNRAQLACEKNQECKDFNKSIKTLTCGKAHVKNWGTNGFHSKLRHWCKEAFAYYKFTSRIFSVSASSVCYLAYLNNNGNIVCYSEDGKTCINDNKKIDSALKKYSENPKIMPNIVCGIDIKNAYQSKSNWCNIAWSAMMDGKVNSVTCTGNTTKTITPQKITIEENGIYKWKGIRVYPFHRYLQKRSKSDRDHFYTTSSAEIGTIKYGQVGKHGFVNEGIAGYCLKEPKNNSIPLYRYYNSQNNDHFYTTNAQEIGTTKPGETKKGYKSESVACNCFATQIEGTSPLHRYWSASYNDHFYTTNFNELQKGNAQYKYEGIQCYIPTDVVQESTPPKKESIVVLN